MSNVLLFFVKNNRLTLRELHFREAIRQLNDNTVCGVAMKLDAGYMIIDYDNATVINAQNGFAAKDLRNPLLTRFSWLDI
jgi:hypothetical protein